MRLGLVADNHGLVDPALRPLLEGVDEILHAGDLVTTDILQQLRKLAPVQAVRGNNDVAAGLDVLPEELLLERAGLRLLVRHIVGRPGRLDGAAQRAIRRQRPRIVVAGHSHRPLVEESEGVLFVNPGSCGPRRFKLPRCAGVLEFTADSIRVRVVDLDDGTRLADRTVPR
jgi:hypothetical protein